MIDRRKFLGIAAGAGAALALTPELLRALQQQQGGKLIQRAIPSTGEMLPVIGFAFANARVACRGSRRAQGGPQDACSTTAARSSTCCTAAPAAEQVARTAANELGIQNKLFWTTPRVTSRPPVPAAPPKPDPAAVKAQIEAKFARFKVPKIDLVMVRDRRRRPDAPRRPEGDEEGGARPVHRRASPRIPANAPIPVRQLEAIMRNEPIDFIGIDYAVGDRRVEETILPLALERKIGVMAYFPFDQSQSRTSSRASAARPFRSGPPSSTRRRGRSSSSSTSSATRPSPWPARGRPRRRTCSTTSAAASAACRTRRRGSAWRRSMDALPALPPLPQRPGSRHPGSRCPRPSSTATSVSTRRRPDSPLTFRRDGDRLFVKPGTNPEAPLIARSETRFQDPRGPGLRVPARRPGQGDRCHPGAAGSAAHPADAEVGTTELVEVARTQKEHQ